MISQMLSDTCSVIVVKIDCSSRNFNEIAERMSDKDEERRAFIRIAESMSDTGSTAILTRLLFLKRQPKSRKL